jgi:trans-aconitate 2-methyltransferase
MHSRHRAVAHAVWRALTVSVTDWDGRDYGQVSGLQRAMVQEAMAGLVLAKQERVLDVGCGDGFLTFAVAGMVPDGCAVGVDASRRMIEAAHAGGAATQSGPWFVVADARRLPFAEYFDVVVSFNALHWVPEQRQALAEIASVVRPGGRVLIQVVCAGERTSLESVAMAICQSSSWAPCFDGFTAPFVHVDPAGYGELAASAGLTVTGVTVTDREWDFGSLPQFLRWCTVGSTAWTDRLPPEDRARFVNDMLQAYEAVSGRPGLFRFTQMRAELRR